LYNKTIVERMPLPESQNRVIMTNLIEPNVCRAVLSARAQQQPIIPEALGSIGDAANLTVDEPLTVDGSMAVQSKKEPVDVPSRPVNHILLASEARLS
jgi:hypothetical protein